MFLALEDAHGLSSSEPPVAHIHPGVRPGYIRMAAITALCGHQMLDFSWSPIPVAPMTFAILQANDTTVCLDCVLTVVRIGL